MKFTIFFLLIIFNANVLFAAQFLTYLESAYKNNPVLNASRANYKAIKENINISISEYLPSVSISGSQNSQNNSNRTSQTGGPLPDSSNTTSIQSVSVEQKIFQGFQGYNSIKKSQLETSQAKLQLKNTEQQILLQSATAYYDLVYKIKNTQFNSSNIDLFERQVESDSSRLQKGEITLTDLAQSESSLAGANAKFIAAETELLTAKSNFERIIRLPAPDRVVKDSFTESVILKFPPDLDAAFIFPKKNNPQ